MNKTEIVDFWVGVFESEDKFSAFVDENPDYYKEENEDSETNFISEFARSQGEKWIDHDFMEVGYNDDADKDFAARFVAHSYGDQWMPEIARRVSAAGLVNIDSIIILTRDRIKKPVSVVGDDFVLTYIGTVEYTW